MTAPQFETAGAIARLQLKVGALAWEAAQWEQAYYDQVKSSDAVTESLSRQVESLRTQLEGRSDEPEVVDQE